MSLADLSIRRPVFITCIIIVMLVAGGYCMQRLGVDLFPDVNFPIVTVTIPYPGAGPSEIETLVTKPVEDEISTIAGMKRLTSKSIEGISQVVAEFYLETDIKYAEQQVRDRVSAARPKLPSSVKEPVIRRIDPSDQPILVLSLKANLGEAKLFDLADDFLKPRLEQVPDVGLVEISGGQKREIQVQLNRNKLHHREIAVSDVAAQLSVSGENVPSGKLNEGNREILFRSLGEFHSLDDIRDTLVNLFGNEVSTTVSDVGTVQDTLEDEKSRVYMNGVRSLFLNVYRQSGANTIAVVNSLKRKLTEINNDMRSREGSPSLIIVRDGSKWIKDNVEDVKDTILLGILLTIIVVYFFLANGRSTLITGLALPNSLLGAFVLMSLAGFTINIVTLLALSLAVGLLIDDAIVVRENIFRHIERGKKPIEAATLGTAEVRLAVIATTLVVIAVFGPVAFMKGMMGQFFRQFGLTICFAMLISLFDALTIAPMLSAYFARQTGTKDDRSLHPSSGEGGAAPSRNSRTPWALTIGRLVRGFSLFQDKLEAMYVRLLRFTLKHPLVILSLSLAIFLSSFIPLKKVPKTFMPTQDAGEFVIAMDLPPGTSLPAMNDLALQVDKAVRAHKEVAVSALTVGGRNGEANQAEIYVQLVPSQKRTLNTSQVKEILRGQLKAFAGANPKVQDYNPVGGGSDFRPFMLRLMGNDQAELEKYATAAFSILRHNPGLIDTDTSYRPGKPEMQIALMPQKAKLYGVNSVALGAELRAQVEGVTPAKYREQGREYDVRVRLLPDERNLRANFNSVYVPNVNHRLIRLADVARYQDARGPSNIDRQDRGRYIQISGDVAPGAGLGDVMGDVAKMFETEIKLPPSVHYTYVGDSENFQEFAVAMGLAIAASVIFIYLVLSSLYESFVTPFTIMLALPLAVCGAFFALYLAHESVNLFSMIGVIMLLGVASKNSILLVDYANTRIAEGQDRASAIVEAGRTRLRPILMTTMALIAGTLPVALGLDEASRQRTSMGVAIIGGLISSTLLTLVVVPAAFSYIDRYRLWSKRWLLRWI